MTQSRFVLILSLLLSSFSAHAEIIDRLEAAVNSKKIFYSDILDFRRTIYLRAQLDPLFRESSLSNKTKLLRGEIVEYLIDEKMMLSAFPVSDSAVENEINQSITKNKIDRATLKRTVEAEGYEFRDYYELIRATKAKRNLIDQDIRSRVHITEDDIKNYFYNTYKGEKSKKTLKYRIRIITVSPQNYKSRTAARQTATRTLQAIRAGESFASSAKKVSDHPSSTTGGDLGFLESDDIAPMIKSAIKKLKVGGVSDVFEANEAFFIIKLDDLKSGQENKLAEVREQIMSLLTTTEYRKQISLWVERERSKAYIHRAGDPPIPAEYVAK